MAYCCEMLQKSTDDFETEKNQDGEDEDPDVGPDDLSFSTQSTANEIELGSESSDIAKKNREMDNTPAATKAKRRKSKENSITDGDKTLQVMGKYFERKAASSSTRNDAPEPESEEDVFCRLLAMEMKKVKDPGLRRNMKRKVMDVVMDMQERQEEEDRKQVVFQQEQQAQQLQVYPGMCNWMLCPDDSHMASLTQSDASQVLQPKGDKLPGTETLSQEAQLLLNLTQAF